MIFGSGMILFLLGAVMLVLAKNAEEVNGTHTSFEYVLFAVLLVLVGAVCVVISSAILAFKYLP